ncbi:MAG: bifunctional DNA-formamidopyrimidine glycosylase/DNA-(apurinic or apyrimidinic site) lyase [Candidatus Taylorbacteria bacterium]|nr:bifunctional DNA-formamidopyrimidine glycosylase/DNA-(apurinic or apyrimidinic site) lyase [Candidatus Taylorbacteria bacterium]
MPELPEVHTTATMLQKLLPGLRIKAVWTNYDSPHQRGKDNIKDPKFFRRFARKISGARFKKIYRRGKNVLLDLDNGQTILIHMKMTGHLLYGKYKKITNNQKTITKKEEWRVVEEGPLQDLKNQFIRFVIALSNGKHLALSDMRRFAKVTIIATKKITESEHLKKLGPEPLDPKFTFAKFRQRLMTNPRGKIKQVLMDPKVVAGIGNIYSDETLYLASIHPLSIVGKVPEKALRELFRAMKKILAKGIDLGGDSTSDYRNPFGVHGKFHHHHQAYRNTGNPCSRKSCGGTIHRVKLGGRSAHFCNIHQYEYN